MARTGVWFQFARGRALVRTNAMKEARRLKRLIVRGTTGPASYDRPLTQREIETAQWHIGSEVRRARQANRDWRRYRKLWEAEQADNAEIERYGK
jgi:hypothetical protein